MHMAPERKWSEFPYQLRSLLGNIRNTARLKTGSDIPHRTKKIWSALVQAVDALEAFGFSSIDGLRKSLDGIENLYWRRRLEYVLEDWANDPDMSLDAPVSVPVVEKIKRKKPEPPTRHEAPLCRSSADAVWLEFTGSSFYRETKTIIILNDPATEHLVSTVISRNRHSAYVFSYFGNMRMLSPDRSIRKLDEFPEKGFEPADILICGCKVFNKDRQIFSGIPEVHTALDVLKAKGLLGKITKKLGLAYFQNNQYRRDYFRNSRLLFTADAMLTENGNDIENYADVDAGREVIEMQMELEKRKLNEDGVSLF